MFSAKVVAQLLHKRRQHHERNILYIPSEQTTVHDHGASLNKMKADYFERQVQKRIVEPEYQQDYGY